MLKRKPKHNEKGQAVIEMALSLPLIIWLIYYTINAYFAIHTAQVGQRYAAMSTFQRMDNRAIFVVDGVNNQLANRNFMAVQYQDPQTGALPQRKIIVGPMRINTIIGVCREPRCD